VGVNRQARMPAPADFVEVAEPDDAKFYRLDPYAFSEFRSLDF